MGSILGDFGGDGDFDGWVGADGGIGSIGVFVGGGVVVTFCDFGDGVGVTRLRKFSSLMGDDMISGDSSEDDEFKLMVELKQQGLTLILAVLLMGRDGGDELLDFVMVVQGW